MHGFQMNSRIRHLRLALLTQLSFFYLTRYQMITVNKLYDKIYHPLIFKFWVLDSINFIHLVSNVFGL